tara:strand:+ start:365 stop:754 length:390 start_codon:yes stop_codon:yes gene_type:complete
MLPISIGVSAQAIAAAGLSGQIENVGPPEVPLFQQGVPSGLGEIDFIVNASGGSGSYTFAWKLVVLDSGLGMLSTHSQGQTNAPQYNTGQVIGGQNQGAPALAGVECQISDGVNTPITLTGQINVIGLY